MGEPPLPNGPSLAAPPAPGEPPPAFLDEPQDAKPPAKSTATVSEASPRMRAGTIASRGTRKLAALWSNASHLLA